MDYKYMKIFHEVKKTVGIRTYSNEADQANEDKDPTKFEILQQEEMVAGEAALNPAKLEDAYYPIEHFKELPAVMAGMVPSPYVEEIKPNTLPPSYGRN